MLERLLKWLKGFFNPKGPTVAYRVIRVFERRDFCCLAMVARGTKREIATYRAIPRYPTERYLEIWVFCEHLYKIPNEKIFRKAGCNHSVSVFVVPAGTSPSERFRVFYKQLDLLDMVTRKSCAAVFTQMFATILIRSRHDDVDWEQHCEECQEKALKQVSLFRRRKKIAVSQ